MKIRHGFVSNSSSSSFIVVFPKHIGSAENMGKILFRGDWNPDQQVLVYDNTGPTQQEIADRVYADYCEGKKESAETRRERLISMFANDMEINWNAWSDESLVEFMVKTRPPKDIMDLVTEERKLDKERIECMKRHEKGYLQETKESRKINNRISDIWSEKSAKIRVLATTKADSYLKTHSDYTILCLEYGDESGPFESTIEHGDTFKNLISKRISNH